MKKYQFWMELFGEEFWSELCANEPELLNSFQETPCKAAYDEADLGENFKSRRSLPFVERFLKKTSSVFAGFYEPYVQSGYEMLQSRISGTSICAESFIEDFLKRLLSELEEIGIRILIKEMHEKRKSKEAAEESLNTGSEDWYKIFCGNYIVKDTYRKEVLCKYPVLARALKDAVSRNVCFYAELVLRTTEDKEQIQDKILGGRQFQYLIGIDGIGGDTHSAGKKVLKLKLDTGHILIYKPHSIKNEHVFYRIVSDIGLGCGTDMYTPRLLECGSYGWMECVESKSCQEPEELRRYYYRLGVQLLAAYLLGTNDIHCENLIACGEYPVIIDLENLVSGEKNDFLSKPKPDKMSIKNTVLGSGILPYSCWQLRGKGIDLSAISGGEQEIPFQIPVIKEPYTGNMHIGYRCAKIGKTNNKAMLNGKIAAPEIYETELRQGFEIAYWFSMTHKIEMKKRLAALQTSCCRWIVRDTQKYFMLLSSSYHPSVMEDMADREILLHSLWREKNFKDSIDRQIVNAEIDDLLCNDIPFFYFQPDRTSLFDSRHREITGYFVKPPMENIYERLDKLNLPDLNYQMNLIHLSLLAGGWENFDEEPLFHELRRMMENSVAFSKVKKQKMAENIADKLLEQSRRDERGLHWNCLMLSDQENKLARFYPCGMYLYDGIAGYTVFLHMLTIYTLSDETCLSRRNRECGVSCGNLKSDKYGTACKILEEQLFCYTERGLKKISDLQTQRTGLYNGEGSIVYTYLILYHLHGKEIYLDYAKKHAELLIKLAEKDKSNDLLDGKAGAIYALCMLYQASEDREILQAAEKIGDALSECASHLDDGIAWENAEQSMILSGMAHGNAGILTALAKLYTLTKNPSYYEIMKQALEWEHAQFDKTTGDWKDNRVKIIDKEGNVKKRNSKNQRKQVSAWCHGAAGILLSRLKVSEVKWEQSERIIMEQDIQRSTVYLSEHMSRNECCLCHGICGNQLIMKACKNYGLTEDAKILSDVAAVQIREMQEKNEQAEKKVQNENRILTKEWFNPGLMNGYVGLGYYLLSDSEGFVDYIFLEDFL